MEKRVVPQLWWSVGLVNIGPLGSLLPRGFCSPSWDMGRLNAAKANGLKVVGILGPNWHYTDNYDPAAMSNLAAWIAKTGLVIAFEVTNEPNNAYASYERPTWETKLVALTNAVTAAVHAVNPSIQVIHRSRQSRAWKQGTSKCSLAERSLHFRRDRLLRTSFLSLSRGRCASGAEGGSDLASRGKLRYSSRNTFSLCTVTRSSRLTSVGTTTSRPKPMQRSWFIPTIIPLILTWLRWMSCRYPSVTARSERVPAQSRQCWDVCARARGGCILARTTSSDRYCTGSLPRHAASGC
jgi:hypothetical protein